MPPELAGSIALEEGDYGLVLCLRGELDTEVVDRFDGSVGELPLVVAVDAGETSFFGSSALALLIRCARRAAEEGQVVTLRRTSRRIDRVLEIVGAQRAVQVRQLTGAVPAA